MCARVHFSTGSTFPSFPVLEVTCGIEINEAFPCSGLQASLIEIPSVLKEEAPPPHEPLLRNERPDPLCVREASWASPDLGTRVCHQH